MFLCQIVPIKYIPRFLPQKYSYFSQKEVAKYALVEVFIGQKNTPALVLSCQKIKNKIQIKKAGFSLKPIVSVLNPRPIISLKQLKFIYWLSDYYFLSLSGILKYALPSLKILEKINLDFSSPISTKKSISKTKKIYLFGELSGNLFPSFLRKRESLALFKENKRFYFLKRKIEKIISQKKQVLIIFPDQVKLENYAQKLKEFNPVVLENKTGKKFLTQKLKEISSGKEEIVLGSEKSLFLPFDNLGLVVLMGEQDHLFKIKENRIDFNAKKAALKLAEFWGAEIIFQDNFPGLEAWNEISFPALGLKTDDKEKKPIISDKKFDSVFSPLTIFEIKKTLKDRKKILIFSNRKGFAQALICRDCGHIFRCPNCEAAVPYFSLAGKKEFHCRHCQKKEQAPERCPACRGYFIKFIGSGTEKIFSEIKNLFPQAKTLIFDSDRIKSFKKEKETADLFYSNNSDGPDILVATKMFEKFLDSSQKKIGLNVIADLEQLTCFPDFRILEQTRNIVLKLVEAGEKTVIQTNSSNLDFIFSERKYFEKEMEMRKKFFYPPYGQLIKISFSDKSRGKALSETSLVYQKLKKVLGENFSSDKFRLTSALPAFIPKIKDKFIFNIFVFLKKDSSGLLPEELVEKRNEILETLSKEAIIEIDPRRLI